MTLAYRLDTLTEEQVSETSPFPRGVRLDFPTRQSPEAVVLVVAEKLKLPVVVNATHVWADITNSKKTAASVRKQWARIIEGMTSGNELAAGPAADVRSAGSAGNPADSPGAGGRKPLPRSILVRNEVERGGEAQADSA